MAILKQNESTQAIYLGWYGKCGESECEDFGLASASSIISKVIQFTEDGVGSKTYVSDVPDFMNSFTKLVCGNPYYIILKTGEEQLDIPNLIVGHYTDEAKNFGMISESCSSSVSFVDEAPNVIEAVEEEEIELTSGEQKFCTKDVRVCPDGTSVSRDGYQDCNFPPCGFDKNLHKEMATLWKKQQHTHYKFDFNWSCYCTDETTQIVTLYVKFGKIYKIVKKSDGSEISLAQNEGIKVSEDKKPVPMKYFSMTILYEWFYRELKTFPFSVKIDYDKETGFIKSLFIDKVQDIADEEIGFNATNFVELEHDGTCPSDYFKCKDGTLLKRDPNNECKFPPCPEIKDKTPLSIKEPKLEYRWVADGDIEFLQIKNINNPFKSGEEYLSWRTVYGALQVNPTEVKSESWKHARVGYYYPKIHGETDEFSDLTIGVDDDNKNQIIILLGNESRFHPQSDALEKASHLYVFNDDKETTFTKSYSFPRVVRTGIKKISDVYCTEDVKICEDGTVVSRDPTNDCEFKPCPDEVSTEEVKSEDTTPKALQAVGEEETPASVENAEEETDFETTNTDFAEDEGDFEEVEEVENNIEEDDDVTTGGMGMETPTSILSDDGEQEWASEEDLDNTDETEEDSVEESEDEETIEDESDPEPTPTSEYVNPADEEFADDSTPTSEGIDGASGFFDTPSSEWQGASGDDTEEETPTSAYVDPASEFGMPTPSSDLIEGSSGFETPTSEIDAVEGYNQPTPSPDEIDQVGEESTPTSDEIDQVGSDEDTPVSDFIDAPSYFPTPTSEISQVGGEDSTPTPENISEVGGFETPVSNFIDAASGELYETPTSEGIDSVSGLETPESDEIDMVNDEELLDEEESSEETESDSDDDEWIVVQE